MISIIMPIYNGKEFLKEAVRSVQAQTLSDWELILIDDASTDESPLLAERLSAEDERIVLLKNSNNLGAAVSRNRGIQESRGEIIAFLDCDDLWHPQKLEMQLPLLSRADVVYSSYALMNEKGKIFCLYHATQGLNLKRLLKENVIGCSSVMLRRDTLKGHFFRPDFYHEDYVLWLELLQSGKRFCGLDEILMYYRLRSNSRAFDKLNCAIKRWEIYRRFLKLSLWGSGWYLFCYMLSGLRKYVLTEGGRNHDRTSGSASGNAEGN